MQSSWRIRAAKSNRHAHFVPSNTRNGGDYFLGTPARSARAWVTASQKISSTFSLDRPTTSILGTPVISRRMVVEAFALVGLPQRAATLAVRDACPPLRAPVRAVVDGRPGTDLPFLHLDRFHRDDAVVVLGEPVGLLGVEVDPLDAVGIPAARRDHVHRRHR